MSGSEGQQLAISQPPYPSFTTLPVDPGVVLKANDATDVTAETAKVSGEIERPANPDPAADTNCRFEYVTDAQFQANGFQSAGQAPCGIDSLSDPRRKKSGRSRTHRPQIGDRVPPAPDRHQRRSRRIPGGRQHLHDRRGPGHGDADRRRL